MRMARHRQLNLFHVEPDRPSFEDLGNQNGGTFWYARDFMGMLGYESYSAFQKPINKAIATCTALNIPVVENFQQTQREIAGQVVPDLKLTRFACYLVAINGDVHKPEVASAQAYFITMAEAFRQYLQGVENVERVQTREEISVQERSLSQLAGNAGLEDFPLFQNAGYRGMYCMNVSQLRHLKGVASDRSVLDFMGREELAANLFRITQTGAKIRNEDLHGQVPLENAAYEVGRTVRKTMIELSGHTPESLPAAEDIKEVRKDIKQAKKEFGKLDKPGKKELPPPFEYPD
jgi:DNA-damage-inducible protein D